MKKIKLSQNRMGIKLSLSMLYIGEGEKFTEEIFSQYSQVAIHEGMSNSFHDPYSWVIVSVKEKAPSTVKKEWWFWQEKHTTTIINSKEEMVAFFAKYQKKMADTFRMSRKFEN